MRTVMAAGLALVFSAGLTWGQTQGPAGSWKGKFEVFQFNLTGTVAHSYIQKKDFFYRGVDLTKYDYDLYQNPQGLAREELVRVNRALSVEGLLEIRLLDFNRGYGLVFNKSGPQAIRGPLAPPVPGRSLGERRILGFTCGGKEYRWETSQQATIKLQSWSPEGSSFRVPLIQVEYLTDRTGALLALTIRLVTHLEETGPLPPSLFEPRTGLRAVHVPYIY